MKTFLAIVTLFVLTACQQANPVIIANENSSGNASQGPIEDQNGSDIGDGFDERDADGQDAPTGGNPDETEDLATREPAEFCGLAEPYGATVLSEEEALSYLALVNRCYRVARDFSPHDLRVVNVPSVNMPAAGVHHLRDTVATALEALFEEAEVSGLNLLMSSGYRSYELQTFFHTNQINARGLEEARRISAIPGHSEHQLGLGVDLTTLELEPQGWLAEAFTTTPEGIWINQNAHRFGFIISYPRGREEETGFIYEPWHIRYVGIEAATEIFNQGLILEEYLWYNH